MCKYGFRSGIMRINERFANIICAIPPAEAEKFGVAEWFVRQAKTNMLDAVSSSTKTFLDLQNNSRDPRCLCLEFMNVLAASSHCGFATEAVSSMFQSCLNRIVHDKQSDNLDPYPDCGVRLHQVLSVLAKARSDMLRGPADSPKYTLLREILERCREKHTCQEGAASSACHTLDAVLDGGLLNFFPAEGFSTDELWAIGRFQDDLLDHVTPWYGESAFEFPYGKSPWPAAEVRGLMKVKTSHYCKRPWGHSLLGRMGHQALESP